MNTVNPPDKWAWLIKRRAEIALTLRHLEHEQSDIEAKEASMDRDARQSRLTLLRDLNDWYSREIDQVDQALRRADQNDYGVCRACRGQISVERLDENPGAEYCADCQNCQQQL